MNFHTSVLLDECIKGLNIRQDGIYVDGTFGGGGHTTAIAPFANRVIAIDKDVQALERGTTAPNVTLVHGDFCQIADILQDLEIVKIDGVLLDLGISSHQIDTAARGFSYMKQAKLDMRMDTSREQTAYDVINGYTLHELTKIFKIYGEEPFARPIAKAIEKERTKSPIETTTQLAHIVTEITPKKFGLVSVKRVFQAVRIEVNNELNILETTVNTATEHLNTGGRMCIITFHSLEDRIIKHAYNRLQNPCTCPRDFPHCVCGKKPQIKIITKRPILPTAKEIEANSRAKSAKLRIAEKI
ncbi:MAG: 16S rRNA (cytosine(1402)-N(4))-methyltransferase RsmH [Defluviitaleaceae bacterium]|nr:16S rRNA (cytosine(1402)-N(4))-methyltransferase RsmH [Defluviitaleaceae bacterium]